MRLSPLSPIHFFRRRCSTGEKTGAKARGPRRRRRRRRWWKTTVAREKDDEEEEARNGMKNWLSIGDWRKRLEYRRAVWRSQKGRKVEKGVERTRERERETRWKWFSRDGGNGTPETGSRPACAAKSAHSAALLDRLRNINLQHYRLRGGAPAISSSSKFLWHASRTRNRPQHTDNPSDGFRISRHLHSPRNIDNSITNLFIATESRRSDCVHSVGGKACFFGIWVSEAGAFASLWFDSQKLLDFVGYLYIFGNICMHVIVSRYHEWEKLTTISLWIECSEDNAESHQPFMIWDCVHL